MTTAMGRVDEDVDDDEAPPPMICTCTLVPGGKSLRILYDGLLSKQSEKGMAAVDLVGVSTPQSLTRPDFSNLIVFGSVVTRTTVSDRNGLFILFWSLAVEAKVIEEIIDGGVDDAIILREVLSAIDISS